ncbi:EamA family transporter RarD [Sphingomonas crocodyli]|uniref:EamA family transporter RarD n=1 Tax=Sphingomonas crocodyli TaxID=1979270 RepID=A0A437LVT4_9SPHN|nr:EamA family transporter RarD [Sphingomonas crocodyli]RVT89482.1 EamA family transporter RarD [Sphingomonas crocodyli]
MPAMSSTRSGIVMGASAYAIWGLLPLFLKQLQPLGAVEILSHRVIWSLGLLLLLALALRRGKALMQVMRQPKLIGVLAVSAALIGLNWLVYVHAVNEGHTLQASLGYFINPLVNVLLGMVVLRERLGRAEWAAVVLAGAGVAVLTIGQGALPTLSLILAISFGLYGLVRKMAPVESLEGLLVETALLTPLALGWLLLHDGFVLPAGGPSWPLVISAGIVTATPLMLFAAAAKRMRYSELGLLQYIAPTLQLMCALAFGEPLLPVHMLAFAFIWSGLAVYGIATWHKGRVRPMAPE